MMNVNLFDYSDSPSATGVNVNGKRLFFSYKVLVAVEVDGVRIVSENCWKNTTGKHLNAIDGGKKSERLPREEFMKRVQELLGEDV